MQAAEHAIAPAEAQLAAAKAEMEAAIARFKALELGLDGSRKDLARKHAAAADFKRKQEVAAAEEKKRREEQVRCSNRCGKRAVKVCDHGGYRVELKRQLRGCRRTLGLLSA